MSNPDQQTVAAGSMPAPPPMSRNHGAMFASIRLPTGIFKTTAPMRLVDVDAATIAALPAAVPGAPAVDVIDVGASTGTTTLELLHALRDAGRMPRILLTDIALKAQFLRLSPRHAVLVSPAGALLQHVVMGLPLRTWRRRLDYVTQFWAPVALANARFQRLRNAGLVPATGEEVWLVAPAVQAEPALRCAEGDVFARCPADQRGRFDIVRAANVLLPEVFEAPRIRVALAELAKRMRGPGALLVLARSPAPGQKGRNRATIYRMGADGSLAVAMRLGGGSELEFSMPRIGPRIGTRTGPAPGRGAAKSDSAP